MQEGRLQGGREAEREGEGGVYQHPLQNCLFLFCKHFVLITFLGVKICISDLDPDSDPDPELESGF